MTCVLIYDQLLRKAGGRLQRRAEVHLCKADCGRGCAEECFERCGQVARIYARGRGRGDSTTSGEWLVRLVFRTLHGFLIKGQEVFGPLASALDVQNFDTIETSPSRTSSASAGSPLQLLV